jgi:hypothetical protein
MGTGTAPSRHCDETYTLESQPHNLALINDFFNI